MLQSSTNLRQPCSAHLQPKPLKRRPSQSSQRPCPSHPSLDSLRSLSPASPGRKHPSSTLPPDALNSTVYGFPWLGSHIQLILELVSLSVNALAHLDVHIHLQPLFPYADSLSAISPLLADSSNVRTSASLGGIPYYSSPELRTRFVVDASHT